MEDNLNFSPNAILVLKKRYLKKDKEGQIIETPKGMLERVSKAIAGVERNYEAEENLVKKLEEAFFKMMANLEFMPNSPTLMNAGKELGQLSACFVVPVEDSMESIFDAIKATALIHKTGGGTGFSFSKLRPKNSVVRSTGGVASGPVSFMKVFDAATQAVKQGGTRRGANMGILRVDHPDILEFIKCKEKEGEISNFNISVAVTDEFMEKVFRGEEYDLIDPHTHKKRGKLKAKEVFDLIAYHAWLNGEPGIVFIDRINEKNPCPHLGRIESTNPCVTGDTLISTEKGLMRMKDLFRLYPDGGIRIAVDNRVPIEVKSPNGKVLSVRRSEKGVSFFEVSKVFCTGVKEVYKIETESGYELEATADHKVLTTEGWIQVKDLAPGKHEILIQSGEGKFGSSYELPFEVKNEFKGKNGRIYRFNFPKRWNREIGQVLGLLVGDGWLREGKDCRIGFTFSKNEKELLEYFKRILNNWYGKEIKEIERKNGVYHLSYHSKYFVEFFKKFGIKPVKAEKKSVPESIFTAPKEAVIGFLQGLFTTDGTLRDSRKSSSDWIAISSKSLRLLKELQIILLNLGIKSKIFNRSRKPRIKFSYTTKSGERRNYACDGVLYELGIFGRNLDRFAKLVGFISKSKTERLRKIRKRRRREVKFYERIVKIEKMGKKKVYDLTQPVNHSMCCNCLVVHQCGEQPLLPYESCNLGSINLAKMLKEKNGEFEIDWEKLARITKLAVRFLDNVIDANKFPLPQIRENTLKTRKIGLGVMGWATLLGFLGIPYDSQEALDLAEELMSFIYENAKEASISLAKERGVFPAWRGSLWERKGIKIRNATLTTIAPTGSISIIAGPTSTGIEPFYSLVYFRNVLEGERLLEVEPSFEYIAKKRGFYSKELMEKIAQGESIQNMKEVPQDIKRVFKTALEISPLMHIKMQASFQKYVDNAVSKTINLPNKATIEDVKEAFIHAYKLGCKGITVYRDGSRNVQVLTKKKEEKKIKESSCAYPKPRPEVIVGTTTKITTGCGNLYVTLNQDEEGNFFEVFIQMGKAGGCAASQLEAIGRLISLALRGGIDIKVIIEQLKGIRCPSPTWTNGKRIFSCADAIARVLEKRLQDQKDLIKTDIKKEKDEKLEVSINKSHSNIIGVCPECGSALRHQEGCCICDVCGFSKC